jgi:RNA polymerase sigma-54 factor
VTQPSYVLSARQQINASPQLQQAVRLLQMSTIEFEQELRQALATNPFLEEDAMEDAGTTSATIDTGATALSGGVFSDDKLGTPFSDEERDPNGAGYAGAAVTRGGHFEGDDEVRDWACAEPSLREHLREQLCSHRLTPRERLAVAVAIESLDDDGYLRGSIEEAARTLDLEEPLTPEELNAAIRNLQQFDPVGVGARNLAECLERQLEALPAHTHRRDLALMIVRGHLEALGKNDWATLRRRFDCNDEALHEARALIRRLDPKPGESFSPAHAGYVTPDVIVSSVKGRLKAIINPEVLPRAHLNRNYIELLRRSRENANPALNQQLQEARWLLRNTEQRFVTIKRVADAIIERQRAFFAYGEIALKPMGLRDVADALGLHESTVSRATGNKYMATPRGTFQFKHFFSRQLTTHTGGTCSATAVRALMQEMLDAERGDDPLSDVDLARMLREQGIRVARRTVAKYRNQMRIPPAELRRHI